MRTVGSHTSFEFSSNSSYCLSLEYNTCTRNQSPSKENFRRWVKFLPNAIIIFYFKMLLLFSYWPNVRSIRLFEIPRFDIYIIPLNCNFFNYSDCYSIVSLPCSYFIYCPNSIVESHILAYSIVSYYILATRPRIIC